MADLGDWGAAAETLAGALERAPGWAAGWFRLGEYLSCAGQTEAAALAFGRAAEADPSDRLGAGLKRDLLLGAPLAETMPAAFVELLFDQYAPRFETSLVDKLNYRGPEVLWQALVQSGFRRAARALDLGCGTGLAGAVLRPYCGWLGGYDISAGMLAEGQAKGLYDLLEKRDIGELERSTDHYDLIVAVDVFMYLGALERIIGWCAASLGPQGRLAFTVELGSAPVQLRDSCRFAHSRDYVQGLMRDAGFAGLQITETVLRQDRGQDVAALCVVAAPLPLALDLEGDGEAPALV